jgi:hypothetical protein
VRGSTVALASCIAILGVLRARATLKRNTQKQEGPALQQRLALRPARGNGPVVGMACQWGFGFVFLLLGGVIFLTTTSMWAQGTYGFYIPWIGEMTNAHAVTVTCTLPAN